MNNRMMTSRSEPYYNKYGLELWEEIYRRIKLKGYTTPDSFYREYTCNAARLRTWVIRRGKKFRRSKTARILEVSLEYLGFDDPDKIVSELIIKSMEVNDGRRIFKP